MWANFSNLLDSLRGCMELVNFIKIRMSRDYVKLAELNWIIWGQNDLILTYLGRVDFIQVWKKAEKRCFCSLLLFNISHSKRERGGGGKGGEWSGDGWGRDRLSPARKWRGDVRTGRTEDGVWGSGRNPNLPPQHDIKTTIIVVNCG